MSSFYQAFCMTRAAMLESIANGLEKSVNEEDHETSERIKELRKKAEQNRYNAYHWEKIKNAD